jgi:hypothetical protein
VTLELGGQCIPLGAQFLELDPELIDGELNQGAIEIDHRCRLVCCQFCKKGRAARRLVSLQYILHDCSYLVQTGELPRLFVWQHLVREDASL